MRPLKWVFENQPIVSGISTQPSSRKQFATRLKRSLKKGWEGGKYVYIHLYYRSVVGIILLIYKSKRRSICLCVHILQPIWFSFKVKLLISQVNFYNSFGGKSFHQSEITPIKNVLLLSTYKSNRMSICQCVCILRNRYE